jgi:hypothetical protein
VREQLDLGCAPSEEDCAQVGSDDYHDRSRRECRAYIAQLRRIFGEEPPGASLFIKSNPHDFGTYLSVVCSYASDDQEAANYAFGCEAKGPRAWDEQARKDLGITEGA